MAFYEDFAMGDIIQVKFPSIHDSAAKADYIVVHLQYPIRWLYSSCAVGNQERYGYSDSNYDASRLLFELSHEYGVFDTVFTYASRGHIELELNKSLISVKGGYFTDSRYEAYDRLIPIRRTLPDFTRTNIVDLVQSHLIVREDTFHYQLGRRLVSQAMDFLKPIFSAQYQLPDHWEFPRYSLIEFRRMASVLGSLGFIHYIARILSAQQGCVGLCINSAILVIDPSRLSKLLERYSGVEARKVEYFIEDFTLGSRGIRTPDPAIQPLVRLTPSMVGVMPNLIINSSMERNWISLINRIAGDRPSYLRLANDKEQVMRTSIVTSMTSQEVQSFTGRFPGDKNLPDIDLALISQKDKVVLVIELKWFIAPSEVREVLEKSEEISKGINQALALSDTFASSPELFYDILGVDNTYKFHFLVLSENSIGGDWIQDKRIPVLESSHFCRKANSLNDFRSLIEWMSERRYLPIEGTHYEIVPVHSSIGEWSLNWYGLNPLVTQQFDP